jgi:hypothetical protein
MNRLLLISCSWVSRLWHMCDSVAIKVGANTRGEGLVRMPNLNMHFHTSPSPTPRPFSSPSTPGRQGAAGGGPKPANDRTRHRIHHQLVTSNS